MAVADLTLSFDPAPPWSAPILGPLALVGVAVALVAVTVVTYRGTNVPARRLIAVIALRLVALLVAVMTVLRPSLAIQEEDKTPSTLIVVMDCSKSMSVVDEIDNKSRSETLQKVLQRSERALDRLREEYNVAVKMHWFSDDLSDEARGADGARTDFGQMLRSIAQRYAQERTLRGMIILSDGADNGVRYPAQSEAARFRTLNCPIHTFVLGRQNTSADLKDLSISNVIPDPSPVPVKGKLAVRATIDAPGFENTQVIVRLFFKVDDTDAKEVVAKDVVLTKPFGNEVELETSAPSTPGEVKLTVKVDERGGEATLANNEFTTYLTVTKEGISVLIIDRLRLEEKFLRRALVSDPRFRVYEAIRQTDDPPTGPAADLYRFDLQGYDVIVIGDVSASRLSGGDSAVWAKIEELVRVKGVGLLMVGGQQSFAAGGWIETPISNVLPVHLDDGGQVDEPVRLLPSPLGRNDYVMKIGPDAAASETLWRKLPPLPGFTKLGRRKDAAVVIGQSANGTPLLVRQQYNNGRSAALALDETWQWQSLGQKQRPRTNEGTEIHARFWRQLMLYLAKQEEIEGSVWIKPDLRRVNVGGKVGFSVGVRGKSGLDLPDGKFEIQAIGPDGKPLTDPIPTAREKDAVRGTFWKTEQPGEYKLLVKASAKDVDGTSVNNEATARLLVFQDDTELLRPAADHDFMSRLAQTGGGQAHLADELPTFLDNEAGKPLAGAGPKVHYFPDWRSTKLGVFPPMLFAVFVLLLGTEWGLRRWWGMV